MAKTVMIFGAGASIPFFNRPLTTAALTAAVQDEARWKSLLRRYTTVMQNADCKLACTVTWDPIWCLIQRANNVIDRPDFEQIIELIDKYSSYSIGNSPLAKSGIGLMSKYRHDLFEFLKACQPAHKKQYWQMVPFLFRQLIAETIGEWDRRFRSEHCCALIIKQMEFLSGQTEHGCLSVYSFNYDDVLPRTKIEGDVPLETGFVRDRFDSVRFLNAPSILASLHGHASWAFDGDGIRQFRSISDANRYRLTHLFNSGTEETLEYIDATGSYDFNTFMTAGLDKEPSFSRNPYCSYYQRMASDLMCAETVIIVGFSFRDPHIDRLLLNFLDLAPKKNKVLVVDLWECDIDPLDEFTNPVGFLRRVLLKHGVQGIPLANTTDIRYKWEDRLTNTNRNGFGFLCPQIWIYKKGYGEFLSEWQTVLKDWRRHRDP